MNTSTEIIEPRALPESPKTSPAPRPAGLFSARHLWVFYLIGCGGMGLDAMLANAVMARTFDLSPLFTIPLLFAYGGVAAKTASSAAVSINRGDRTGGIVMLVFVTLVGLSLGYLRWHGGVAVTLSDPGEFAVQSTQEESELPATVFMLVLYFASAGSVFLSARKLFVQERVELQKHAKAREEAWAALAPLEAEYTAIHEHIANAPARREILQNLETEALEQLQAREKFLKDDARDAIARFVGRPDATPLVRAPHQPEA